MKVSSRRWRRLLRPATLLVLVAGAWLIIVTVSLLWARADFSDGIDAVGRAQRLTSPRDVLAGKPLAPLDDARDSFSRGGRLLGSPVLAPLKLLPVAGRQLRSAEALSDAAAHVTDVSIDALNEARRELGKKQDTGAARVELLRTLATLAGRAHGRLADLDLGPGRALIGPLADKRSEFEEKLERVRRALADGRAVAGGLAGLLDGPRRYLVLAANNGEMRAGSGMFLSIGELTLVQGELRLGEFLPAGDITLEPAAAPPVTDADLAARWGWLNPNREWRNLGASPRFSVSAALAAAMWQTRGGAPVDGVLALDPVALRNLLSATGPVDADGTAITEDGIVRLLLRDQYAGLDFQEEAAQDVRRDRLGSVAAAVVAAIQGSEVDVAALADALAEAVRGRHLLAWSRRAAEQRVWRTAGADGELSPSSLLVAVLNRGGNKLDQFLDVSTRLTFRQRDAELEILLRNRAPRDEAPYVIGPHPEVEAAAGEYVGLLSVNLPGFVSKVRVDGQPPLSAAGDDGPTVVVALPVRVAVGAEQAATIRFRLPASRGSLRIEPTARVPGVRWAPPIPTGDEKAHVVSWG